MRALPSVVSFYVSSFPHVCAYVYTHASAGSDPGEPNKMTQAHVINVTVSELLNPYIVFVCV